MNKLPMLVEFADLRAAKIVDSWTVLNSYVANEGFPPGRLLSARRRVWTVAEVTEWLASRPTAKGEVALTDNHVSKRRRRVAA